MKHFLRSASLCLFLTACGWTETFAQAPGSVTVYNGSVAIAGYQADISETLYIGPGTYTVDGTWEIYSKNVVIDPAAVITGTGTIQFYNPSVAGGAPSATFIDGNDATNAIEVNVVLNNAQGITISEIPFPADLTGAGFTNNTANNTLSIGKGFDLAVDGANVTLGSGVVGDFTFDDNATLTGYSANRMVITNNSSLSHMVKENYTGSFVFPIGIAAGDYTPATVTPATAGTVHASVQDYSIVPPTVVGKTEGMDRTWHIYADAAVPATVTLQHNSPATDGADYVDNMAFVTQNQADGSWSSPGTTDYVSAGLHTNATYTLPGAPAVNTSYFTKASDVDSPLPVTLISFDATPEKSTVLLSWSTSSEMNSKAFDVERSRDARNWITLGTVKAHGKSDALQQYSFTDANPVNGSGYYRLRMVDMDGSFALSKIKLVHSERATTMNTYPNPASGVLNVTATDWKNVKEMQIFNLEGKAVYRSGTNPATSISLQHVPAGIHILSLIRTDGSIEQKKIVIAR